MAVVVADVTRDGVPQEFVAWEVRAVDAVGLEAVKEGLHARVVADAARPVHALRDPVACEQIAVGVGAVLHTAIRVEDEARLWFTQAQRAAHHGLCDRARAAR